MLGEHAAGLRDLWLAWEVVGPVLFEDRTAVPAEVAG
jgi:hypothetical protein